MTVCMNKTQRKLMKLVEDRAEGKVTRAEFGRKLAQMQAKLDSKPTTPPSSFGTVRLPGSFTPDLAQDHMTRHSHAMTGRFDVWEGDVQLAASASYSATVETLCLAFGWERAWVVRFMSQLTRVVSASRSNNVWVKRVA